MTVGTPKASLAATDYALWFQIVEGINIYDFQWGSASAKPAVLRFDVFAPAGTYTASIRNSGARDRSFLAPFTVANNVWTTINIRVSGDTTGVWPVDTGGGLIVGFTWATGTTYTGVAGWQAGNMLAVAGATNGLAAAQSFYLKNVGLYLDPLATGVPPRWQMPDEAEELRACQRYWYKPSILTLYMYSASNSASAHSTTATLPSCVSPPLSAARSTQAQSALLQPLLITWPPL